MSGKQKALLIVIGVALVVLFVVGVGVGAGKGTGDPNKSNGFVDWLENFAGDTSVDPATVTASCEPAGQPNTYQFSDTCKLTVADPGRMKLLILRSPQEFGVNAPAPGDGDFTMSDKVQPSPRVKPSPGTYAEAKIAVDKRTEVEITCPGSPVQPLCVVTVATK
jgi:hypothetical protein